MASVLREYLTASSEVTMTISSLPQPLSFTGPATVNRGTLGSQIVQGHLQNKQIQPKFHSFMQIREE